MAKNKAPHKCMDIVSLVHIYIYITPCLRCLYPTPKTFSLLQYLAQGTTVFRHALRVLMHLRDFAAMYVHLLTSSEAGDRAPTPPLAGTLPSLADANMSPPA